MNKLWMTVLALLMVAMGLSAGDKKEWTVGTNAEFAPFSYVDDDGLKGFEIDIVEELSQRMNYLVKWVDMPFEALIPEVMMGNVDLVAAGITITEERAKRVAFSQPYLSGDPLVILSLSTAYTLEDLPNLTVAVNESYTADLYLSDNSKIDLMRLPTPVEGMLALKSGRADVFVTAKNTVLPLMQSDADLPYQLSVIPATEENCAFFASIKNQELIDKCNLVIQEMIADGTVNTLKAKWGLS